MEATREDAPFADELPTDFIMYWTGYPMVIAPKPFKINLLHKKRTEMVDLCWDAIELLLSNQRPSDVLELFRRAQTMSRSWQRWHHALPHDVRYNKALPMGIVEFQ